MTDSLKGLRILVAEDEGLVALDIEAMLESFGCSIIGPVSSLEEATRRAGSEVLDGAILDINLRGKKVFPAAETLGARGIPFIFSSGYDDADLFPDAFRCAPRVMKPYGEDTLAQVMSEVFAKRARS